MKRKQNIVLQLAAVVADGSAIILGAWSAYMVRFSETVTQYIPIVTALPPVDWYVRLSVVMAGLTLVFLVAGKQYNFPRTDGLFEEITKTSWQFLSAYLLLLAMLFFYRQVSFSRVTMILLAVFSGFALLLSRIAGRMLRQHLYRAGVAVRRAAIVGDGHQASHIRNHLAMQPHFGIQVIGSVGDVEHSTGDIERLGEISQARHVVEKHRIDTLIIALGKSDSETLPALIRACYGINVEFLYLPEIHPTNGRLKHIMEVDGVPLWTLKETPFEGWHGLVKRAFDLVLALLMFTVLLPVLILLAVAIKFGSRGPVLYAQKRVGLDGSVFTCLKFRSMHIHAEDKTGPVWATQNDPRVTKIGRFMRRFSLDELPQLWNVLRGDMSLVGPRPERPEFVLQFEQQIDGYNERHRVKAGITGWAQVSGMRGDTPIEDRTDFDRYYVENWTLGFDIKILFLTALAVLKGENAY